MKKQKEPLYKWAEDATSFRLELIREIDRRLRDRAKANAHERYIILKWTGRYPIQPIDVREAFNEVIKDILADVEGFKAKAIDIAKL